MEKNNIIKLKKGFIPRDFVVSMIVFSTIVSLMVIALGGFANEYDLTEEMTNAEFSDHYDKLTDLTDSTEAMRASSINQTGFTFKGVFDNAFQGAFTTIGLVFSSLTLMGGVPSNLVSDFTFLDAQVITIVFISLIAIITVILTFVWLSSISRGKI